MSSSTFFVSKAALRNLKHGATSRVRGVSSSHLCEAIAAALGFQTYAALRTALAQSPTVEASKPNNTRLRQRLRELGYPNVPDGLQILPALDRSYTPFRTEPLRARRSQRWQAWRNLLVMAINAGLDQRVFGLSPNENWWTGGNPDSHKCERGTFHFTVNENLPAVASVDAISGDELSISVILSPKKSGITPDLFCGLRDGSAVAHCWLERHLGAWIQDGGEDFRCKRDMVPFLSGLSITPSGYADQGSFIM